MVYRIQIAVLIVAVAFSMLFGMVSTATVSHASNEFLTSHHLEQFDGSDSEPYQHKHALSHQPSDHSHETPSIFHQGNEQQEAHVELRWAIPSDFIPDLDLCFPLDRPPRQALFA